MPITLDLSEGFCSQTESQFIKRAAEAALQHQSVPTVADLSILITGEAQIQELNRRFRKVDSPTDVLAFPAELTDPESGAPYLGDVVICYPKAEAQALAAGHSIVAELQLLTVHGILHLMGHDHVGSEQKTQMWAAQAEIIDQLDIAEISLPE